MPYSPQNIRKILDNAVNTGIIVAGDKIKMTYIHEHPNWPKLTWDTQALAKALAAVRHKQGRHLGKMEALGFELRTEAGLISLTMSKWPRRCSLCTARRGSASG